SESLTGTDVLSVTERDGVDVVMVSEGVALEIASSVRSGFGLIAYRPTPTRLGNQTCLRSRARNPHSLRRDFELTHIGPLLRRPPRHQRRPFRRLTVGLRDCVTATRSARGRSVRSRPT